MTRPGLAIALCVLFGCSGPGLEPPGGDGDSFANSDEGKMGEMATSGVGPTTGAQAGSDGMMMPAGGDGDGDSVEDPQLDLDDGGVPDGGADSPLGWTGDGNTNPFWSGTWVIEQPFHALYEATHYELKPGGDLVRGSTHFLSGPTPPGYMTGSIEDQDAAVNCFFSTSWTSDNAWLLTVGSTCSDGTARDITLSFDADAVTSPFDGMIPTIDSVQGGGTWVHNDFDWQLRKCSDPDNCLPF